MTDTTTSPSTKLSPALRDARAGLAKAVLALREAKAYGDETGDWEPQLDAIAVFVEWNREIERALFEEVR